MSSAATSASTAAAAQRQAVIQASLAHGAMVGIEPHQFRDLLGRAESPLVVFAEQGWLRTVYVYLTNYKGIFFYTRSDNELFFPPEIELVKARRIAIPAF